MTKNISQIQPILFKDILKKENPKAHILFSEVLQMENVVQNIGAVSSSFNPNDESEVELTTQAEEAEDASMDLDQKLYDRMKASGLLNGKEHKSQLKKPNQRDNYALR